MAVKPRMAARFSRGQRLVALEELDPGTPAARKALEFRDRLLTERGGADRLSVLRKASIDTVSCLTIMVEDRLAQALAGQDVDLSALNSLLNSRRREAELIGVDPPPLDVTPTIDAYLKKKTDEAEDSPPTSA